MSGKVGLNIVKDGLIFYIDAANNKSYISGSSTCNDLSQNQLTGSLISGSYFTSSNGGSFIFDGVNDYIDFIISSNLNIGYGSWNAWIKPITLSDHFFHTIIGKSYASGYWFGLYQTSSNIQLWIAGVAHSSSMTASLNSWSYVSSTWDGNYVNFYINGIFSNSVSQSLPIKTNNVSLKIGTDFRNGTSGPFDYHFTGNISNIQLYNRALSAQEVLQNFNTEKSRFGL